MHHCLKAFKYLNVESSAVNEVTAGDFSQSIESTTNPVIDLTLHIPQPLTHSKASRQVFSRSFLQFIGTMVYKMWSERNKCCSKNFEAFKRVMCDIFSTWKSTLNLH